MPLPFTCEQLWEAWERVRENEGCAGSDGVTVAHFAARAHRALPAMYERVNEGAYRPFPLLKIVVEKHPGSAATRTLLDGRRAASLALLRRGIPGMQLRVPSGPECGPGDRAHPQVPGVGVPLLR
jgi:hypothetical protein